MREGELLSRFYVYIWFFIKSFIYIDPVTSSE